MSVEKGLDELWIGVKFQSNTEIAGSPRNSFRASVVVKSDGGRALNRLGGVKLTEPYQTPNAIHLYTAVRLCEISLIVERETAQTIR